MPLAPTAPLLINIKLAISFSLLNASLQACAMYVLPALVVSSRFLLWHLFDSLGSASIRALRGDIYPPLCPTVGNVKSVPISYNFLIRENFPCAALYTSSRWI